MTNTEGMKRLSIRVLEAVAGTYFEERITTPVVKELRMAMLIHRIDIRLGRGSRANAGITDMHFSLANRSFDGDPNFEDEDVITKVHGNSIFLTATGEPDVVTNDVKVLEFPPDHPFVYAKPFIYAGCVSLASTATQTVDLEIWYTVKVLSKDEWIAAVTE
jgi:hypothetical protein